MNIDQLKAAAMKATEGPWDSFEGGNFTQVWVKDSKFGLPSQNMIADVNYRQNDKGENTPTQSRNNARYIAAASPEVILALIQKYEEATKALQLVAKEWEHNAPSDCYSTGPHTGSLIYDHVSCPGCAVWKAVIDALPASPEEDAKAIRNEEK